MWLLFAGLVLGFATAVVPIYFLGRKFMALADDLSAAVTANTQAVSALQAAVTAFEGGAVPAAPVQAAVTQIGANTAAVNAVTASLNPAPPSP